MDLAECLKKLRAADNGLLYEDPYVQIGVKSQWQANQGRVMLYLGNKHSAELTDVSIELRCSDPPGGVGLQTRLAPVPSSLGAKKQVQVLLELAATSAFAAPPTLALRYAVAENGSSRTQNVVLDTPYGCHKFLQPWQSEDPGAFFAKWRELSGKSQKIEIVRVNASAAAAGVTGFADALRDVRLTPYPGLDPNPKNIVAAGIVPYTQAPNTTAMVRVESDANDAAVFRVTVAADDAATARASSERSPARWNRFFFSEKRVRRRTHALIRLMTRAVCANTSMYASRRVTRTTRPTPLVVPFRGFSDGEPVHRRDALDGLVFPLHGVLPVNLPVPERGGRGVHPRARLLHEVARDHVLERLLQPREAFQAPLHNVRGPLVHLRVHERARADGLLDARARARVRDEGTEGRGRDTTTTRGTPSGRVSERGTRSGGGRPIREVSRDSVDEAQSNEKHARALGPKGRIPRPTTTHLLDQSIHLLVGDELLLRQSGDQAIVVRHGHARDAALRGSRVGMCVRRQTTNGFGRLLLLAPNASEAPGPGCSFRSFSSTCRFFFFFCENARHPRPPATRSHVVV